jgi:hypothetical protein
MKKIDREKLADTLGRMASVHGAKVNIDSFGKSVTVTCEFPEVSVSFDIDNLHGGGILASWYGARRDFAATVPGLDSVNTCHWRKGTQYGQDSIEFGAKFYRTCKAVQDGRAFS